MADQRGEIINFIKDTGPILPVQLSKKIGTNILFASAMLSELVSSRLLKMTRASIGGSPLYYLEGQEELKDKRLGESLSGREKEIYNLLRERKVLRERDLLPWQRVAVRDVKDFSVLISVKHDGNEEIFWKHILIPDEDAKIMISSIMDRIHAEERKIQEIVTNQREIIKPNFEIKKEEKKPEPLREKIEQKQLEQKVVERPKREIVRQESSEFYNNALNFLKANGIEVLKEEIIKKNKEINFIANIPSTFGKLKYLIKFKSKTSITEGDVSMAYSEGHMKKVPVILLVDGKISKKAALLVEQKMQGQLVIRGL